MGKTQKYDHMKLIRRIVNDSTAATETYIAHTLADKTVAAVTPVILLDGATASLDAENETVIQEALSRLIKNKTVLIIAHRMRTIANADHIVVLKDGVVAEEGSPAELSSYDSIYSRMTKQQLISQNWKM